ncbi:MAG: hypothetical protein D8M58_20430 [Calditrichaeota bacterium]|nr:MAG: hypothetical protein DWQ03_14415 [Calditrichota bacterium]MBL1207778.1 hypothetical protein [Calditrichota bacterium]NOG47611.1 hypothetical protein [Calditrichota bacterium]
MKKDFLDEIQCYQILQKYGISTPKYIFLDKPQIADSSFQDGDEIVLKAVVDEVWHKSDFGLIKFSNFSREIVEESYASFSDSVEKKNWKGLLICEKVKFINSPLPVELLLSIKMDASCGPIITIGFGGVHTELWGNELKKGVLSFSPEILSTDQAFAELSVHLLGNILFGKVRNGEALVSEKTVKDLLESAWELAANLTGEELSLIEINPLAIDINGKFVALDGVGEKEQLKVKSENGKEAKNIEISSSRASRIQHPESISQQQEALFNPQTFLIAGVSSKKKAFGNIVLDNFKKSLVRPKNIFVLKADCEDFDGYKTIPALNTLTNPVDVLVLAVPAKSAIDVIEEACSSGLAKIIYLVAGGIGDGADHTGLKEKLTSILEKYPIDKRPRIIGPNSLGIVLSPQKINTLFIPENKLPVKFFPDGNIGLIAQSGAFFITRISRNENLPIRLGFCIGNQIDISATDLLIAMADDNEVKVIALYLEGAPQGDALRLAKVIRKVCTKKKIIIYRGGRSPAGMKAASGHTGALASDYSIEKKLLQNAGAIISESFTDFENNLMWYSAYPDLSINKSHSVGVISNAGYESVAAADGVGNNLAVFSDETKNRLNQTLENHRLSAIVTASNPLDITPMASDDVYYKCACDILTQPETSLLIKGIVPLSVMIESENEGVLEKNVERIKELISETGKPVAVVIDSGMIYQKMKTTFAENGIPLFSSIQDVFAVLK